MNEQFDLFVIPPTSRREVPPLSQIAIAYVMELDAACDRGGLREEGRSDFIRAQLRHFCGNKFANRRGLSRKITRTRIEFDSLTDSARSEVDRLRPQAAEAIKKMYARMFP